MKPAKKEDLINLYLKMHEGVLPNVAAEVSEFL